MRHSCKTRFKKTITVITVLFMLSTLASLPVFASGDQEEYSGAPKPTLVQSFEISDNQIADAIESHFLIDDFVPSNLIDVSVIENVVTLEGTTNNILEKERAIRITETMKGVYSVIDNIKVKSTNRLDQDIQNDIINSLFEDPATESYEINVSVDNGVVELTGIVNSWTERKLAEKVAKQIRGVRDVNNEIIVEIEEEISDFELKKHIENNLEYNPYLISQDIRVVVNDGNVQLTGVVDSLLAKRKAEQAANVIGTKSVNGENLNVLPDFEYEQREMTPMPSDEEIEEFINRALIYDPRVYSFEIFVDVSDGIASLRGVVDNLKAKNSAHADAQNTVGVWYVNNYIKVRPETDISDDEITANVINKIENDPVLEEYNIIVTVLSGKVFLSGYVDTNFEKMRAENLASLVKGVTEVENNLNLDAVAISDGIPLKNDYVYSDSKIYENVIEEFNWSYVIDSSDIIVEVDNGLVSLTGVVDSWSEYSAVIKNAFEAGAIVVFDDIRIKNYGKKDERYYYYDEYYFASPYYGLY